MPIPPSITSAIRVRAVVLVAVPELGMPLTPTPTSLSADGITTFTIGQHVLLTAQPTSTNNGPWIYQGAGIAMTRPPEWDNSTSNPSATTMIQVAEGNTYANGTWRLTNTTDPFVVGTTVPTLAPVTEALNVKHFGALGDGLTDDSGHINAAISTGAAILFFPASALSYKVSNAVTIPATTTTQFANGAKLLVTGTTVTINGPIIAGDGQTIFDPTSTGTFTNPTRTGSGTGFSPRC